MGEQTNVRFEHPKLPQNTTEPHIRLVQAIDVDNTGQKKFELFTVALRRSSYAALSYCWGDEDAEHAVCINEQQFEVTPNLYAFLCNKKLPLRWPMFIDAICIDQRSIAERSQQVSLMAQIYSGAAEVVVWFGPYVGPYEFDDLINNRNLAQQGALRKRMAVRAGQASGESNEVTQHDPDGGSGPGNLTHGMIFMLYHVYWTRMWIVQELLLAQCASLWYGDQELPLNIMEPMLSDIIPGSGEIFSDFRKETDWFHDDASNRLMRACNLIAQRRKKLETPGHDHRLPLYQLLVRYRIQNCKDLHDKVYGLLGLAQSVITPNYAISMHDLYLYVFLEGMYLIVTKPAKPDYGTDTLTDSLPDQFRGDAETLIRRLAWFQMFPRALVLTYNIQLWDRAERATLDRLLWHVNVSLPFRAWIWEQTLWTVHDRRVPTWCPSVVWTAGRLVMLLLHMVVLIPYYMLEMSWLRQATRWQNAHSKRPNGTATSYMESMAHIDRLAQDIFDKILAAKQSVL